MKKKNEKKKEYHTPDLALKKPTKIYIFSVVKDFSTVHVFLRFYHLGWHEWLEFRHYQDTLVFFVKALVNIQSTLVQILLDCRNWPQ